MKSLNADNNLFNFSFFNGDLRKINILGKEIIQRVYFSVRDEEWLNIEHEVTNFKSDISNTRTYYSYDLVYKGDKMDFSVKLTIKVLENMLVVEAKGRAFSDFMKNRIGLCMHLPSSLKGTLCKILHTYNKFSAITLPSLVSPQQPIENISQIELQLDRFSVKIDFSGDIFEMEDQRNWTDASYKIYPTPLDLPFPVEVKKGDIFHHKISVFVSLDISTEEHSGERNRYIGAHILSSPLMGTIIPNNLSDDITDLFSENRTFPFSYLRIDFQLFHYSWEENIRKQIMFALKMNIPVYAVLYFSKERNNEMEALKLFNERYQLQHLIQFISLLSSEEFVLPDQDIDYLTSELRSFFPGAGIGTGTDANFAQLNRNYPSVKGIDFLCYSIHPQEHASDRLSMIENIKGQYDTVKTAQWYSNDMPIHISSLSLYRRFNANVKKIVPDCNVPHYPYAGSNFETAWFVGALHELIIAGAETITSVFNLWKNSSLLSLFEYLSKHPSEYFYPDCSTLPEKYTQLSWKSGKKDYSVIANLTEELITISFNASEMKLLPSEVRYIEKDCTDYDYGES